ncbi:MAG: DEAD/DEAH box helicase [Candidatus Nanoarchaeia archaeon]
MDFIELRVHPRIINALNEMEITEPTEIQRKAIPLAKEGKDVIGMSRTGSGKTCAFGIPLLEKIEKGKGIQSIIMTPTRELAVQIERELKKFGKYLDFNTALIFGGVSYGPQLDAMAVADIVVGTPGRLLDHIERGNLDLSKVKIGVLDEADKMVEMGFIEDVTKILDCTPQSKQMLLFGATLSEEVQALRNRHMHDPVVAKAKINVDTDLLKQYYYDIEMHEKFSLLAHLLRKEKTDRVMIFCSARSTVELVTNNLRKQGIKCEMMHGKLSQSKRLQVIDQFNNGKTPILVASTVAARGLHIDDVSHVFNYDLSQDPQEYIHRIGRTARAGESGKAITLLSPRDHGAFGYILDRYGCMVEKLPKEKFQKLQFDARIRSNGPRRNFGSRNGRSRNGHRRYAHA